MFDPDHPKFEPFANRIIKRQRHIGKWARRQGVSCYRLYDDDIPEFPFAIDRYEDLLHVAEYARKHTMTPEAHADWLNACLDVLSRTTEVHRDHIYLKYRQKQKGLQQYERFARKGAEYIVRENGLKFIINASDYLDTGLFLDHRNTRQMVRQMSEGKRVLNLFAYTGSFSVYAAAGGAAETLTIDMSNTYLQWADRNLALNGFSGKQHRLLQADVLQWAQQPARSKWDLIVVDPPTFSNSKRMDGTLDIQRDHVMLLNAVLRHAAPGACVYFSTNFRRFKIESGAINAATIEDISRLSVPEDYTNKKIHYCFRLTART